MLLAFPIIFKMQSMHRYIADIDFEHHRLREGRVSQVSMKMIQLYSLSYRYIYTSPITSRLDGLYKGVHVWEPVILSLTLL